VTAPLAGESRGEDVARGDVLAPAAGALASDVPVLAAAEVVVVVPLGGADSPLRAGGAVRSVLEQEGVRWRLALVHGSGGPAAAAALAFGGTPFVAQLEPRARLLPGALRRLVDACAASPERGSVFPLHFEADAAGQVSRQGHRRTRARLLPLTRADFDARRELAGGRPLPASCRIYRRSALAEVARGGAGPPRGPNGAPSAYALDLRLAARWRIACVPEFLCVSPAEPAGRAATLARRLRDLRDLRGALRDPGAAWLRDPGRVTPPLGREVRRALLDALPAVARRTSPRRGADAGPGRRRALLERLHGLAADRLRWWRLDWGAPPAAPAGSGPIAYHLWHFPVLSQTFVRREVAALRAAGVEVLVAADGAEDEELLGEEGRALVARTRYTSAVAPSDVAAFGRRLARTRPLALANAFAFVLSRRWSARKSLDGDLQAFRDALRLAALLEPARPERLHAPWADRCAFVALVASRLLGIPFSVQARAHELHDPEYRHPLPDVFRHADRIVTNTAYNVPFIEAHLGPRAGGGGAPPIRVVYNGLDLERFAAPAARGSAAPRPARILCVARLIEQKGLLDLLHACALLRERGIGFACDVVGGPEHPLYTNYLVALRREHRRLGLGDHVRFLGARSFDRTLRAYAGADVFVLPCVVAADGRRDVTPNAVLEAMAMALPVVSTPVGGVPELVEDGVSGVLVPPGDPLALAGALASLIDDPARRRQLGEAARRRAEERFDARRTAAEFREVFAARP
jgi:glycosyltransferase involved in cell wall biosynthesis